MLPFVLMAQLNSEKSSQGCPSLQNPGSPAKACFAARSFFLQVFQLPAMRDACMMVQGWLRLRRVLKAALPAGCGQMNFAGTRATGCQAAGVQPRLRMMTGAASAAFVARASDAPPCGALGVVVV
jgi:hypothetical protein